MVTWSMLALLAGGRGGALPPEPKPTYLPPWFGGRWSGRLAFAAMRFAKNCSFCEAEFSSSALL